MAYVNYVREHMAFIEFASDKNLTGNERTFWYALIHEANRRANGSDWPEDFISIPNSRLLALVPFSENKIPELRNRLRQLGLIDFRKGDRNKRAPEYKIIYFSAELSTGYEQDGESYHRNGGNFGGNFGGNNGSKPGGNLGSCFGNPIINLNDKPNRKPNAYQDDDELLELKEGARRAYVRGFGCEPTEAETDMMARGALSRSMSAEMLGEAIREAAAAHAAYPMMYVLTLLSDWQREYVRTVGDLDEYILLRRACEGKDPAIPMREAEKMADEAYRRRMEDAQRAPRARCE